MAKDNSITLMNSKGEKISVPKGSIAYKMESNNSVLEINVNGAIYWYGSNASMIVYQLENYKPKSINLQIFSPGGDPTEAFAMMNLLKAYAMKNGATIDVEVYGNSASSATVLLGAAHNGTRKMSKYVQMLYHKPSMMFYADENSVKSAAEELTKFTQLVVDFYVDNSNLTEEQVRKDLLNDKWMNADELLAFGLIDEITENEAAVQDPALMTMFNLPINNFKMSKTKMDGGENTELTQEQKDAQAAASNNGAANPDGGADNGQANPDAGEGAEDEGGIKEMLKKVAAKLGMSFGSDKKNESADLAKLQAEIDRKAADDKEIKEMMAKIVAFQPKHTPAAAHNNQPNNPSVNMKNETQKFVMKSGQKPQIKDNGRPFGMVLLERKQDESALNALEMAYLQGKTPKEAEAMYRMAAWDFTEINAALGAYANKVATQIMREIKAYDDIYGIFTVVTDVKHKLSKISTSTTAITQNFHLTPTLPSNVFGSKVQINEIYPALAAVPIDPYQFAHTYFGNLQQSGFTPYNYPAGLALTEMILEQVQEDIAVATFTGVYNGAVAGTGGATRVTMMNGWKKVMGDIRTAVTGGVAATATGTIYGNTAGFHQGIVDTMAKAIDIKTRHQPMVLYAPIDFATALQREYGDAAAASQFENSFTVGMQNAVKARYWNIIVQGCHGLQGSQMLFLAPKSNLEVMFDSISDTREVIVRDNGLGQIVYVPFQVGVGVDHISTKTLAINNQA